uniref:NADH-ubiquinone oxidoreductase chain 1 n=1 Tax=Philodromus sp. TaxID=2975155 RepID=A0A977LL72_9ARAC|nr:NADH dehydrogenase subunit 1 [Philodromus sp.]
MISLSILISVAFYTILERKFLGYIQIRKGPNKVGLLGILQPISDAVKLFNKNLINQETMNMMLSSITPAVALFLSILMVPIMLFNNYSLFDNKHNILFFFILSSMSVYVLMLIGWSANSKYSMLGSIRSVAQMISYEVSFFLIMLSIALISMSYSFHELMKSQMMLYFFWGNMIIFMLWMLSCLAETNRSPFDFAEGESELVSGFNVEYMGGWFALIFLAEYMMMIMMSLMSSIFFFKTPYSMMSFTIMILITMTMLWVRGTFPRYRYDILMKMSWKIMLPTMLFMCSFPLWLV